ncbi:MAG: Hsp20/alpha crystallin family protein [bacterium]|nr:Hsp20/alpha crystallin family protein [bacterium]
MASFFEKLIGGQDQDQPIKEKKMVSRKPARKVVKASQSEENPEEKDEFLRKLEVKKPQPQFKVEEEIETEPEGEEEEKEEEEIEEKTEKKKPTPEKDWSRAEGQLSIDVYQTDGEVVIESTIGGVKPENLEVTIENGMVQIKGNREKVETVEKDDYLIQECHWGSFSRQFVLPSEVDASRAEATLKDGILTVRIPRIQKEKVTKLMIK